MQIPLIIKRRTSKSAPTMAETNGSLVLQQKAHHQNLAFQSLLHHLDPISLILSQNQNPNSEEQPVQLKLVTENFIMERGPRYRAYAELRESKLRMKNSRLHEPEEEELESKPSLTPPPLKKQVKFQSNLETKRKTSSSSSAAASIVAQSVPDFSSMLRKENRKPPPPQEMMTPPAKSLSRVKSLSNSRGSKSANSGDSKRNLMMARKSYTSLEELKGFSLAAANAINGENKGRGGGRRVLGYRPF